LSMENIATNRPPQHLSLIAHHFFTVESILIAWFITTPVASFFVRYPLEKSIITYDRAVVGLVIIMLLWKYRVRSRENHGAQNQIGALRFEIAWALLSVLMLINVAMKSGDVGPAIRTVIDGFWLPLAVFHIARSHFDLRGRRSALLLGAVVLGVMLFAIGAYEFVTGTDLFHYSGSELIREGELRVNGPFASDSSYAIICMLIAVFLAFAPRALNVRLDRAAKLTYGFAIAASIAAAMLPQFRVVAAAMLVCWLIFAATRSAQAGWLNKIKKAWRTKRFPRSSLELHPFTMSITVLVALAALSLLSASTSLGQRLGSLHNVYGRLATWEAAVRIAAENPLLGVGITNYGDYFRTKYFEGERPVESLIEARAALTPHSNLLWVAAEVGALAFALYLIANVYIFRTGARALNLAADRRQRAAAACFLALAIAYCLPGLTLTSGIYADLNLYFFFLLGLLANSFQQQVIRS
jgi:O-antigen ligase